MSYLALAAALAQMVGGMTKAAKADKLERLTRQEAKASRNQQAVLAKGLLNDPLAPGASQMYDRADAAAASALSSASQYGNPMSALAAIAAQQQRAYQDIGIASAQDQKSDTLRYADVLQGNADRSFAYNMGRYSDLYNEGREMVGASMLNAFGALANTEGFFSKTPTSSKPATAMLPTQKLPASINSSNQIRFSPAPVVPFNGPYNGHTPSYYDPRLGIFG